MSSKYLLNSLAKLVMLVLSLLMVFSVLGYTTKAADTSGKELKKVITSVSLLDAGDTLQTPDNDGVYQIRTGALYKLRILFDLKAYDDNLKDVDYFTFAIPAILDVQAEVIPLTDQATGVIMGDATVTSNGKDAGGTVTVRLKNLKQYLDKTGGDRIKDVQGNLAPRFIVNKDVVKASYTFDSNSVVAPVIHKYTSKTIQGSVEGYENFSKNGGQAEKEEWTSPKLATIGAKSTGSYVSNWRVRVNSGGQNLGSNIVVKDFISQSPEFAVIQYIPESLKVYETSGDIDSKSAVLPSDLLLVEGTDYTVQWNANYTSFDIVLKDGSKKYFILYQTTTPGDGQKVGNSATLSKADGTVVTQRSNNTITVVTQETISLISGEISAATDYTIKIKKVDAFNYRPIKGAVYTVTAEDGSVEEVTTDADGIAVTKRYEQDKVGKTFIIKEKTSPAGYKLDTQEYKVVLPIAGKVLNLKDEPIPAGFDFTAKKVLEGKELTKDAFEFELLDHEKNVVAKAKNDANGNITFTGVEFKAVGTFNYSIREVVDQNQTGIAFDKTVYPVVVTVTSTNEGLKASTTSTATFTNKYAPKSTTAMLEVNKTLTGKKLEADEFEFVLSKDGAEVATAKNAADGKVSFPTQTFDKAGEYTYTITEKNAGVAGVTYDYSTITATVTVVDENGQLKATVKYANDDQTFENSYKATKTQVPVKKVWNDGGNQDGKRPAAITIKLLAGGVDTGKTLELSEANGWAGTFTELDADKGGVAIVYTVEESGAPAVYNSALTGNATEGFVFTNSYKPETVDITVTKDWKDENNQDGKRPTEITINLLADGEKVDSQKVEAAADGTWSAEFKAKPKYKAGKEIKYTVTEEAVTAYTATIEGFKITNTHTPETIKISGTKVWEDENNQDGKQPASITVKIKDGDTIVDEIKVSAATGWSFESKELPKYRKGSVGEEIAYTVEEVAVTSYETKIEKSGNGKYTITNTHTPEKIAISGQKIWNDFNDLDQIRPESISVTLLADGVDTGKTATASAATGWVYTFEGLDRYKDGGKEIVYSVKETKVPAGYTSVVNGLNITNTHEPSQPEPGPKPDPNPKKDEPKPDPKGGDHPKSSTPKPSVKPKKGKAELPKTGETVSGLAILGMSILSLLGFAWFKKSSI